MRSDIVPDTTFPDYELPDHEDIQRKLCEFQGDDPAVPDVLGDLRCRAEGNARRDWKES
jgi:hypothetical protein